MILNYRLCLLESIYCVLGMCSGPVLWPCVEDLRSSQYVHLDLTHFIIIILCYFDKMAWLNFFWFNEINTYTDIDYNNLLLILFTTHSNQMYFLCNSFCVEDYCDFEDDPEVSCFLTDDLADDDGNWIRNTVNFNMF